ncbi:hypothetical protein CCUS01_03565 [Colletotrichum cuscutae]|uniref:CN hydrolase domain-containing protein n=1 Tax=Colletotrichum cuscutae TaxID=1209917 RepID=A0AAI9VF62_9PEZI|nr:hypothetical protein CCUS01_03565 [Colletotrichum cuscutae]
MLRYSFGMVDEAKAIDKAVGKVLDSRDIGGHEIRTPFPKGSDSHYNFTRDYLPSYIENAIVIGDAQWNRLIAAIQAVGIYANLNFAEVDGDYMYMSQASIDPQGNIMHHRRKLRPSGAERYFFSDGVAGDLKVLETDYGRWGMLECGEHMYPSMTFNMYVQRENVHFAPFPYLAGVGDETSLWWENQWVNTGTLSVYSVLSGAYSFVAAIGATFVIDPFGSRVAHVNANGSFEEFPMLYYNLNTSGFNSSQTYDINVQASWGTLSQIVDSFPGGGNFADDFAQWIKTTHPTSSTSSDPLGEQEFLVFTESRA